MNARSPEPAALGLTLLCLALAGWGCDTASTPAGPSGSDPASDTRRAVPNGSSASRECPCRQPPSFARAVDRVRPAVVSLYAPDAPAESAPQAPLPSAESEHLGSGIIIDAEGHVLTNVHVVRDREAIRARTTDDRRFDVSTVGLDPNTDVALLKLDGNLDELPVAPLGDSTTLEVGDWVIAIGNPLGLNSTVTVGITSGIGRTNLTLSEEMRYQRFIQTDASINPGNSGGPLVDASGEVVGINTAMAADAQGLGFAIPVEIVEALLPDLKAFGEVRRSWVGLYIEDVPRQLRQRLDLGRGGTLVTNVIDGGPADESDLREGDIVVELNGTRVDNVSHLSWMAGHLPEGEPAQFTVQRGSEKLTIPVVPRHRDDQEDGTED